MDNGSVEKAYALAKEQYARFGVDTEAVLKRLATVPISLHCWQGDDVGGFESDRALSGGIMATGNYPGKARNVAELRADVEKVLSLLPGRHRFNLHAIYLEHGGKAVERDQIEPKHFQGWIDWAKDLGIGMDSIRPTSRIPRPTTASRSPIATRESASSGSITASPAARSAPKWAASFAVPA